MPVGEACENQQEDKNLGFRARAQEPEYGKSDLSQDLNFQETLKVRSRQYNASQNQEAEGQKMRKIWGFRSLVLLRGHSQDHLKSEQAGGQQRHR